MRCRKLRASILDTVENRSTEARVTIIRRNISCTRSNWRLKKVRLIVESEVYKDFCHVALNK